MKDFRKENKVVIFTVPNQNEGSYAKSNLIGHENTILSKDEIIIKAFNFHSKGNIKEASKYYQLFLNKGFNDPRVLSNFGLICHQAGKNELAIQLFRRSIKFFPDNSNAYSNLGNLLKDLGELSEAEKLLLKAIELSPTFSNAYSNLGIIFQEMGKFKEAEEMTLKAIKYNPNSAISYSNLGSILIDLGNLKEAEIAIRKAINIDPNQAIFYSNLSEVMLDLGKFQDAEVAIRHSISLGSESAVSYMIFAKILFNQGKKEQAINQIVNGLEIKPNNHQLILFFLRVLSCYQPKTNNNHYLIKANNEFTQIKNLPLPKSFIHDFSIKEIYLDCLKIYNKYQINIETDLSQIYKSNDINLNCRRHKYLFDQYEIIPERCFSCYKVQIEPKTVIDLIKIYIVFEELELENNNSRKCMIELRQGLTGFYKGLIYCSNLYEAKYVSSTLDKYVEKTLGNSLRSTIKRGCSEYALKFPSYKEIDNSKMEPMQYKNIWKKIEKKLDNENRYWGNNYESIVGLNLDKFLVIRNWISYAQRIGDVSVNLLTEDKSIGNPSIFCGVDLKNINNS